MNRTPPAPSTSPASATAPAPAPIGTDVGLLAMVVIWAVNFSVLKVALEELPPLALNAIRFPLAALVVLLILRTRGAIRLPSRTEAAWIAVLGLTGNFVYQLFFIFGLDLTRAGNAALLLAGTPMLTALLSAAAGHERVTARVWVGVTGTLAGIGLVVAGGGQELGWTAETLLGDLLMLGASASWAFFTVGARGPIARHGSVTVTAWTLWTGTVAIFLAGLPSLIALDWGAVSWQTWAAVAYAGILGIALAYLLWYHGVGRIGNTRTAVYSNLVPAVALVVAWVWLGEVPTAWQLAGAAVIIGAITLVRSRR